MILIEYWRKMRGTVSLSYDEYISFLLKKLTFFCKQNVCCEAQMPLITAYSKDGQGHEDKYLDTSRRKLSQEIHMCHMRALISIIETLWSIPNLKLMDQMSRSKGLIPTCYGQGHRVQNVGTYVKILSLEILICKVSKL